MHEPLNSLDQAVHPETLQHSGDLGSVFIRYNDSKGTVLESPVIEPSTDNFLKQVQVFAVEKIHPTIAPLANQCGLSENFSRCLIPHRWDLQPPRQTPGTAPMSHLPVVLGKAYIGDNRLSQSSARNDLPGTETTWSLSRDVRNDFHTRIEGARIMHHMGP